MNWKFSIWQQTTEKQTSSNSMSMIINLLVAVEKQQFYWSTYVM